MSEPGKELVVSGTGLEVTRGPSGTPAAGLNQDPGLYDVPDFVMVGIPRGDRVVLFASRTLTRAELRREVVGFDSIPVTANPAGPVARVPREKRTVIAEMASFTVINAETYPDALRSLAEAWNR
jgi:hypothetical protein